MGTWGMRLSRGESEKFYVENEKLVHYVIHKRFRSRASIFEQADMEDLIQEGRIGLWKACVGFNPDKGLQFSTYAFRCIEGCIMRFLRDKHNLVKIPRAWYEIYGKVRSFQGKNPDLSCSEACSELGVDINLFQKISNAFQSLKSLESEVGDIGGKGDSTSTLGEIIPSAGCLEEDVLGKILKSDIDVYLKKVLKPIDFEIYLSILGDETQNQVGERLSISQVQVSRSRKRIKNIIEKYLKESDEKDINIDSDIKVRETLNIGGIINISKERGDKDKMKNLNQSGNLGSSATEGGTPSKVKKGFYWGPGEKHPSDYLVDWALEHPGVLLECAKVFREGGYTVNNNTTTYYKRKAEKALIEAGFELDYEKRSGRGKNWCIKDPNSKNVKCSNLGSDDKDVEVEIEVEPEVNYTGLTFVPESIILKSETEVDIKDTVPIEIASDVNRELLEKLNKAESTIEKQREELIDLEGISDRYDKIKKFEDVGKLMRLEDTLLLDGALDKITTILTSFNDLVKIQGKTLKVNIFLDID